MSIDKKHCVGCRDNYYNGQGADECWLLKDAKLVTRWKLGWWTPPTSRSAFAKVRVPDCYHQPGEFAYSDELPKHLRKAKP